MGVMIMALTVEILVWELISHHRIDNYVKIEAMKYGRPSFFTSQALAIPIRICDGH